MLHNYECKLLMYLLVTTCFGLSHHWDIFREKNKIYFVDFFLI